MSDSADNSSWIGSMKGKIKVHGDIFSTGSWPSDEEMEASYAKWPLMWKPRPRHLNGSKARLAMSATSLGNEV